MVGWRAMPKHEPTIAELQQLLSENDALRMEIVQLRAELTRKDQTIHQLELKDRAKSMHMGDLHEQIYQLGVANRDLKTEVRNLKLDKERLLERLADKQQYIIDHIQSSGVGPDILGEVLEAARVKK
jgi:regulator of replication initiation timing